jgi:4-hydroxybenzoate polyprenyltransferase
LPIEDQSGQPPNPSDPPVTGSVSTRELVLIFAALAVALVLGYLFLNKLVDMSQEEDCALAHRHNC